MNLRNVPLILCPKLLVKTNQPEYQSNLSAVFLILLM